MSLEDFFSENIQDAKALARKNHKLRSETQRGVLGYKAGDGFRYELYEYIL